MPQLLGTLLAGAAAGYVNKGYENIVSASVNTNQHTMLAAVCAEMIISGFLVLTVLSVGTNEKVAGNSYFGMAVGFVVWAGFVCVGDIVPGSAFNPALSSVLSLIKNEKVGHIWVFIVGDLAGSVVAFGLYAFWHDILRIQPVASKYRSPSEYLNDDEEQYVKNPLLNNV